MSMSNNELTGVVIGSNGLSGSINGLPYQHDSFRVKVLGVDISDFSKTVQFIIVSSGVLFFYVLYGYFLVRMIKESRPLIILF